MSKTRRKKVFSVLSKIFLALWLLSIILFFVVAIRFGQSKFYGNFMGIYFVLGVTFFFFTIVTALSSQDANKKSKSQNKHKKRGESKKPFLNTERFVLGGTVILLLLIVYLDHRYTLISSEQKRLSHQNTNTSLVTPSPLALEGEIFKAVNEYRKENNIAQLNQDNETCKIANRILSTQFWKTNYNVNNYKDICPNCFALSIAEARGIFDTLTLIDKWKSGSKTLETLKDTGKNACVSVDNGKLVLVISKKSAGNVVNNTRKKTSGYYSYCQKKKITVYIDELIHYTRKNGEKIYSTQADIDCYEKEYNSYVSTGGNPDTYVPSYNLPTYTITPIATYPPCTIYYKYSKKSYTYTHLSPEECVIEQRKANPTPTPTVTPAPTTDPALCSKAVAMWNDYKADFYATKYNNYSSSFEALQALEAERQVVQSQIYSYGCTNKISL